MGSFYICLYGAYIVLKSMVLFVTYQKDYSFVRVAFFSHFYPFTDNSQMCELFFPEGFLFRIFHLFPSKCI